MYIDFALLYDWESFIALAGFECSDQLVNMLTKTAWTGHGRQWHPCLYSKTKTSRMDTHTKNTFSVNGPVWHNTSFRWLLLNLWQCSQLNIYFFHRIKKKEKHNCDFLSHNYDIFLAILSLYPTIWTNKKSRNYVLYLLLLLFFFYYN